MPTEEPRPNGQKPESRDASSRAASPRASSPRAPSLADEHTPEAIRRRLDGGRQSSYLRDFVYGSIDGAVTTFAVVSGVAGAGLGSGVVIVLGIANLIADGFSMAVSNYLGTRAEDQQRDRARRLEEHHIREVPEGEREEIRQIFAAKGFQGDDLERVVDIITSDDRIWVDVMMQEEHGLALEGPHARTAAIVTFVAFVVIGFLPLASFVVNLAVPGAFAHPYVWSSTMTALAFFVVGAVKSRFVDQHWASAGIETLLMGGVAASLSYVVGAALRGFADGV